MLREQFQQVVFLARRRVLDQFDQVSGLLCIERLRRDTLGGAFIDMGTVCL
jgi:hypothetical protein